MNIAKSAIALGALIAGFAVASVAHAQTKVPVVGSLLNVSSYEDFEKPFFNEALPAAMNGQMTFDLKSLSEMGLKGPEVLRMVSNGIAPIGTILIGYNTGDDPAFEAVDIAGLAPDAKSARFVTEASFPFYQKFLRQKFNVELLALGSNPGQVIWCNGDVNSLADLAGKKVRVNGKGPSELVAALGGTSVFMSFAEVIAALQNKTVDCMVGGTLPVNRAGIGDVATNVLSVPIGWGQIAYIASAKFWDGLTPEQQATIARESKAALQDKMWDQIPDQTEQGLLCAAGSDDCKLGKKAKMKVVPYSEKDAAFVREVFQSKLLPAWAQRCSADCVKSFNETIGAAVGVQASK